MRISTKGRYGTRAMLALADNYNHGLLAAKQIAAETKISLKYLESLLSTLKAARLVHSVRGPRGGYALSRPPHQISLHDVLAPLEDALDIVHCTEDGDHCRRNEVCCTQEVWKQIKETVECILCDITLADLAQRQQVLDARRKRRAES
ncbi:MAG: RrF2 family transcriptional regulator [bacterium]